MRRYTVRWEMTTAVDNVFSDEQELESAAEIDADAANVLTSDGGSFSSGGISLAGMSALAAQGLASAGLEVSERSTPFAIQDQQKKPGAKTTPEKKASAKASGSKDSGPRKRADQLSKECLKKSTEIHQLFVQLNELQVSETLASQPQDMPIVCES